MIGYAVTPDMLRTLIDNHARTWQRRASRRTSRLRGSGNYIASSQIWSEIKPVYLELQHGKCAYCERKVAGVLECDIEHFRPKGPVIPWPEPGAPSYPFTTGGGWAEGYYLLAYDILNYVVTCKTCNTGWKGQYFPIAGPRGPQEADCRLLGHEHPLLIYPLGNFDPDPETLITFIGPLPVPRHFSGPSADRARVTIDLLGLALREELIEERARLLQGMWIALRSLAEGPSPVLRIASERAVRLLTAPQSPHASCLRAYASLFATDRHAADAIAREVEHYLESLHS